MWHKLHGWRCERFEFWGLACSECGSRKGWRVSTCSRRLYSYVAAVTCRDCGAEYFLKKYRRASHEMECEAQWEYKVLQSLGSEEGIAPTFLVPRVYSICSSTCAFSMELLVGQSLDERMRKTQHKQMFDDCLRLAATWLRGLHSYQVQCGIGKDYAQMLCQTELNCASLAARNRVARRGLELMRNGLAEVEQDPVKLVPLHGDFKASNLIQTNVGVYGIDIGVKFKNAGAMDAAQFMADLILNRRGIKVISKDHDVAGMVDVFMHAYGDNSQENRKRTAWWLLFFLLSWWQRELDGWKPAPLADRLYSKALTDVITFREGINLVAW